MIIYRLLYILILAAGSLGAADTLFFDVSLFGLKVAEVEISENPLPGNAVEIVYHAFTVGAFDKIYDTDNWYRYYTDPSYKALDSLKKHIRQKKFEQHYAEYYRDGKIYYSTGTVRRAAEPVHHVLSFLIYLQHYPQAAENGEDLPFLITDEGELHRPEISASLNEEKAQKELDFVFHKTAGREVLEPTDVFNWMICSGEGERMLAYSTEDHTIREGVFSLGWGFRLKATRVDK